MNQLEKKQNNDEQKNFIDVLTSIKNSFFLSARGIFSLGWHSETVSAR